MNRLLHASIAPGTHKTYQTGWEVFGQFRQQTATEFSDHPARAADIRRFIAWLSLRSKAPTTIATYVAAVGHMHKMRGWPDPTRDFLVTKLLEGCRRDRPSTDSRLPISIPMLSEIVRSLPFICTSLYEAKMFKAAFLVALFGFMRIGEFAANSKNNVQPSVLKSSDIHFGHLKEYAAISFPRSKNNQKGSPQVIHLKKALDSNSLICPVKALAAFVEIRPANAKSARPLFCHFDGSPLTRYQVHAVLKKALAFARLDGGRISGHSFRIGAASSAYQMGVQAADIRTMGRWRSDAFSSYIRPVPVCSLPGI